MAEPGASEGRRSPLPPEGSGGPRRADEDRVWWLWGLAWLGLIASVVLDAMNNRVALSLQPIADTGFSALLVAAAYAYRDRRLPAWVIPAAVVALLVRIGTRVLDATVLHYVASAIALGAAYLWAALVLWRTASANGSSVIVRSLAASHVALALMTVWASLSSAQYGTSRVVNEAPTNAIVVATIFALALTQLVALSDRARARERRSGAARIADVELLAALAELGNTEDDSASLLQTSLRRIGSALGLEAGGVYLPEAEGEYLELVARLRDVALPEDVARIPLGGPLTRSMVGEQSPLFVDDVREIDERAPAGFRSLAMGAAGAVPLVRGDEVLGLLMFARARSEPFSGAEQRLLSAVGQQLAVALQRVRAVEGQAKEAEALRSERRTLRAVLENAPVGVLVEDDAGRIALLNAEMTEHLHAGDVEDWIGRPVDALRADLEARLEPGSHWPAPDGAPHEVLVREPEHRTLIHLARTMRDERGDVVGRVWVSRDATEEHRLEAQLRQAQKMDTIGTLAGGIAHDFNNQLTAILGNASFLRERIQGEPAAIEALDDLALSAEHCARLTHSLLAFARSTPMSRTAVELAALFDEVLGMLRPILPSSIDVIVDVAPGLPPALADRTQLQQVLVNLAVNARDAIAGAGSIELRARQRRVQRAEIPPGVQLEPGTHLAISVRDDGHGMSEGERERVFEPFYTTKEVGQGTGLGLSIVFGAVTSHGGFLTVESEVGRGTTITAILPAFDGIDVRAEHGRVAEPSAPDRARTVLVAEDEERVRALVVRTLRSIGYEVIATADGREAQARLAAAPDAVDVALVDLTMPGEDGLSTLAAMRELRPELPAVVMSGYADAGLDGEEVFLAKPFDRDGLRSALQRALGAAGA